MTDRCDENSQVLHKAFSEFISASQRLEEKYGLLLKDTEALRAEIAEKDREIRKVARLSMLGETAAAIAHEVRNPLGAIKLYLSLIRSDLKDNNASQELLDHVNTNILTIENVVSNILHFAKDKSGDFSPINLESILNEHVEHFRAAHNSELQVSVLGDPNIFVWGDEHNLRQVFFNLLVNAAQATSYQGIIEIEVLRISSEQVSIFVRDNGPGVKEELIDTIFEPFVTSRSSGTGLGLAIVKKIICQHGGDITVRNDNGAVFELKLPLTSVRNN